MKFNRGIAAFAATAIGGCMTSSRDAVSVAADHRGALTRESPAPPAGRSEEHRAAKARSEPMALGVYEVRESAFSDFGMSVKTNLEVKWGGGIEWMLVSGIAEGSSASNASIVAGDRILAIDGRLITEMDRDAMLNLLFGRKKGDRSRFLVLGLKQALPRFVTLVASRPGPTPGSLQP